MMNFVYLGWSCYSNYIDRKFILKAEIILRGHCVYGKRIMSWFLAFALLFFFNKAFLCVAVTVLELTL